MRASLYWSIWWFDILMHFWGGILIGVGLHVLGTFSLLRLKPTLPLLILVLVVVTFSWELFEWWVSLWQPENYVIDTIIDVFLGFSGGLLAHAYLRRYKIEQS